MFEWLRGKAETGEAECAPAGRVCEVGWLVDADKAGFVYGSPRALGRRRPPQPSDNPKAVTRCPAIHDVEARTFEVPCPVDLRLKLRQGDDGTLQVAAAGEGQQSLNRQHLAKMVFLLQRERWRDLKRPVVQISAPYRFVADEPVWMTQLPAYDHYRPAPNPGPLPGLLIGGRFPVDVWPRALMWAFEWHDIGRELVLRRGEPWFYVRFEPVDPARPVRLVEARMTEELRAYCNGLDGVTNYVNQTFQLFAEARKRRPARLLVKADRPHADPPEG
jgi:hypothetical protein